MKEYEKKKIRKGYEEKKGYGKEKGDRKEGKGRKGKEEGNEGRKRWNREIFGVGLRSGKSRKGMEGEKENETGRRREGRGRDVERGEDRSRGAISRQ